MVGGGTTAIEAKILNRNLLCSDINTKAIKRTKESLKFEVENDSWQRVFKWDARKLKKVEDEFILMGDTRRNKMYQPPAYKVMDRFLKVGFLLKEDIIKRQFNCKATGFWVNKSKDYNFLLIMHEHLFVFKK